MADVNTCIYVNHAITQWLSQCISQKTFLRLVLTHRPWRKIHDKNVLEPIHVYIGFEIHSLYV